jgi:hypothetical protein
MRVIARGEGFRITRIMRKNKIYWIDQDGSERADNAGHDHFMAPLLTRNSVDLRRIFISWGVLPYEALREKRAIRDVKEVKNETDPWVRLGRVDGAIQYAYGKPAPKEGVTPPGVWIEQDGFVIRKMRSPSGAEFFGDDYGDYSRNLSYPKTQTYSFNGSQAQVRVLRVASITLKPEQKRQLELSYYRGKPENTAAWPNSGLTPVVQEFYKRFR